MGRDLGQSIYRVRFDDEKSTRTRGFRDEAKAHEWATRNRPGRDYVVVPTRAKQSGGGLTLGKFKRASGPVCGFVAALIILAAAALAATGSGRNDDGATALPGTPASAPPGMFAECKDGTFSNNQDFSKTCSSHHGVKGWLATHVVCRNGTVVSLDKEASCGNDGVQRLVSADDEPRVLAAMLSATTSIAPSPTTASPTTTTPTTTTTMTMTSVATTSTLSAPPPAPAVSCTATMSNSSPTRNSTVTVSVKSNEPNAPVQVSVNYRTMTVTLSGTTDGFGAAAIPIAIGSATIGYTVDVAISTGTARCNTTFTPV
jgi:hypothetical protein